MAEDLYNLLKSMGLEQYFEVFVANDIDVSLAQDLNDQDLIELGLSIGQRKRYRRAIEAAGSAAKSSHIESDNRELGPERRQLTILFADLVGSTQLAEMMDPEDFRDDLAKYRQVCIDACLAHHGHVAFQQGDGIMIFFGYPTASEHEAEDAIRAGFEIIQKVKVIAAKAPLPLKVRVGIATGMVIVGDISSGGIMTQDLAVGEALHLAARLQTLAQPGEVIVSEATQLLAGAMFEYHPPSEQTLKGFTDTINVYKVIGETNIESRFEARAQGSATALFGRESELAVLSGLWRKARRGQGQVVLVTGQPGIGKSRLALGFVKAFEGAAVSKLNLYSASHLTNRALHPFVRELDRFIGFAHTTEREQRLRGLEAIVEANPAMGPSDIPLLADLVGIDLDGQPHLDPQVRARQTMDALVRRVQGVAEASPLLMVFEDAHWADSATLETLALLIERLADMPAMLIITSRPVFQAS